MEVGEEAEEEESSTSGWRAEAGPQGMGRYRVHGFGIALRGGTRYLVRRIQEEPECIHTSGAQKDTRRTQQIYYASKFKQTLTCLDIITRRPSLVLGINAIMLSNAANSVFANLKVLVKFGRLLRGRPKAVCKTSF